jgi:hypothetical protein
MWKENHYILTEYCYKILEIHKQFLSRRRPDLWGKKLLKIVLGHQNFDATASKQI